MNHCVRAGRRGGNTCATSAAEDGIDADNKQLTEVDGGTQLRPSWRPSLYVARGRVLYMTDRSFVLWSLSRSPTISQRCFYRRVVIVFSCRCRESNDIPVLLFAVLKCCGKLVAQCWRLLTNQLCSLAVPRQTLPSVQRLSLPYGTVTP